MPHPKHQQLSQYQIQRPAPPPPHHHDHHHHHLESSLSSSSSTPHNFLHSSNQTSTTKTTTRSSSSCHPCFGTKLKSFSHQHFGQIQNLTNIIPSWLHVASYSRRWSWLKRSCTGVLFMASPSDLSVRTPSEIRKKKLSGQRKREELEREVSLLQRMLNQEEKVHEVLDHVYSQKTTGSAISFPRFLPPKMKELLAELAMVEGEIARLEGQISQLQLGLKHEEATKEAKSKQWQHETLISNPVARASYISMPSPMNNKGERMGYETKALHFISKAIKGDYDHLNDLSLNEKIGSLRGIADQKENYFCDEVKFQNKVPRKNGILRASSPLRAPRYPSPKLKERNPGICSELPPKSLPIPTQLEENIQSWQPNRLSEEIMKCLNFIYVRLLRTTRTMELEKSGPISRSLNSSITSRSFRDETTLNSKSSLVLLQKESRQQDPYGIFNVEDSIPRDIGPYKNLVIFTSISMDPKSISASNSIPLIRKLRVLMNDLRVVDLGSLTYQQKLAFWINMYNACILNGFLHYGVPASTEKLLTLISKATLNIGGKTLNAEAIEHYILRKPPPSTMKEALQNEDEDDKAGVRQLYGLESMDPNVTFALCCGTRSSPAVRIYTAEGVVAELEKSKLEYLQASIVVTSTKKIVFPELLLGNMLDFAVDVDSLVQWVCHQLPTSGSLRKSMVDCFRGQVSSAKISATVEKMPYDFEFQYLLAM
ncbi:hypothetical protein PRUPE_6G106400 [Prunus persica]|uniref:DUF547 domain-containing protein n=1 Tax=Prunus persica TaxID=3760 RepID=A0A251NNC9_PRUPE|nr:uncharacterized protein LOC18774718 [Prunus persica]ONI00829.1 hypothetical protein PRUPE_6G106400 [Prunus persica]